ncbi:thioredoxin-1, putative [Acanthamoeba castellanii str. Neff]|uniref:Thioredoxin n=1 Tax=Acanthamoeba castellanii (strain ATCC 30010 / Neff) TaxID=1257118 RepID=L8GMP8_ACACF|nr:thioredoxin-1, putative [Acanthamoeba castellanii str. Neff]ELR13496.1 thioredoxin-1, putative [Acanthamoeba castellanii str. Neff]
MVKQVTSKDEFNTELANAGSKLVVVDFFATWCGPCKRIAPAIEKMSQENTNVVFLKVDVDEVGDLAAELSVSAMPTFLFFKNGSKVHEVVGASEAKIAEGITKHQ